MVIPQISIQANKQAGCDGDIVSLSSSHNGGEVAWKLNNETIGFGNELSYNLLSGEQLVTAVLTSNSACAIENEKTSNEITLIGNEIVTTAFSLSYPEGVICEGEEVTFSVIDIENGGDLPTFVWYKNDEFVGEESQLVTSELINGDEIHVLVNSSEECVSEVTTSSEFSVN